LNPVHEILFTRRDPQAADVRAYFSLSVLETDRMPSIGTGTVKRINREILKRVRL
jgi:hypothetical protein